MKRLAWGKIQILVGPCVPTMIKFYCKDDPESLLRNSSKNLCYQVKWFCLHVISVNWLKTKNTECQKFLEAWRKGVAWQWLQDSISTRFLPPLCCATLRLGFIPRLLPSMAPQCHSCSRCHIQMLPCLAGAGELSSRFAVDQSQCIWDSEQNRDSAHNEEGSGHHGQ